ncbi:MAG: hypothetical protein ACRDI1_05170, partial [Actinomycetota bacterium]
GAVACPRQQQAADGESPEPSPAEEEESPAPAEEDLVEQAAQFEGNWSGQWRNNTFGSSGGATAQVTVDRAARTVTIVLDLAGQVFGESDPPPQTFTGSLDGSTDFSGQTDLTGSYTATVNPDDNTFTFNAPDVPSARIQSLEGSGKVEGTTFTATIKINFPDGSSAESTLELTKG